MQKRRANYIKPLLKKQKNKPINKNSQNEKNVR